MHPMIYFEYSIIEYLMRGKTNPFPSSEFALLGLLFSGPAHGYELHKHITDPSGIGLIWGVKIANLYAQLAKLESKGWIEGKIQQKEYRPARTQFHLTNEGKNAFIAWMTQLVQHPRDFRQEFMLRYYFLARHKPELIQEVCSRQLEECRDWLKNIRTKQEKEEKESFIRSVIEFRVSQIQSMVEWIEWLMVNPPTMQKGESL
jgi:DNA-binding PadR family transcriptional regulator